VNVRNEVNVPQAQSLTIRRDSDGKITGATLSAAADVGNIARSRIRCFARLRSFVAFELPF
jgi:hypothetical protein